MSLETRIRHVTAVLGPTNTGKTHLAIERMLGHESGMIGLPLRLLAREVYDKIVARVGASNVALVTGEEKIKPERPRYWVATVEAMPRDVDVDFLAIDEVQLAADPDRGHVFTDRLLHARGRSETLMLGAATMRDCISDLIPGANFITRPRLSKLSYSGPKKITRLPKRSAVVAFSAADVYAIAELIRRQIGGAAVVLGALSPRTRNAQVALYQSGDVDYLVATDAIGMGLNLDLDHVAFASLRKFDGEGMRDLTPAEMGQIAGRAGRYLNDGTFGVTGEVEPLTPDLIERLENHSFDSVKVLQWRNRDLDLTSIERLRDSLRENPREHRLQRARTADDLLALEAVSNDPEVRAKAQGPAAVGRLWEVCQVPDYRKISAQSHAELVATLYRHLMSPSERIETDWFASQVAQSDRIDGDIDTLATRIAHIRTWTFVANRPDWLDDPLHWQARTREIEDQLSDALHEQLTQRFVDKRTSALMKGLRDKDEMSADITADGAIMVENHFVGRIRGFRFSADPGAEAQGIQAKAQRNAAAHVLAKEMAMRARRVASAKADAFKLTRNARVLWRDEEIARLEAGEDPLRPNVILLADEHLTGPDKERVEARLQSWISELVGERLKPLVELQAAEDITGLARGIAFRIKEGLGVLRRESVAEDMKTLDQAGRAQLRKYGVRFGAFNIYLPLLLKPAAGELRLVLWALKHAGTMGLSLDAMPEPPKAGRTSVPADPVLPDAYYAAVGYHTCGQRAVRIDILERLADQIRPLIAWKPVAGAPPRPKGATGDGGFVIIPEMLSILGCSVEEMGGVLKSLGFQLDRRLPPKTMIDPPPAAATVPTGERTDAAGEAGDASVAASESRAREETGIGADPRAAAPALSAMDGTKAVADKVTAPAPDAETSSLSAEPDGGEGSAGAVTAEPVSPPTPALGGAPADADVAAAANSAASSAGEPLPAQGARVGPKRTAEPGTGAAALEPALIDIWRPKRRYRGDRRAAAHRSQDQRGSRRHGRRQPSANEDRPREAGQASPSPTEKTVSSAGEGRSATSKPHRRPDRQQDQRQPGREGRHPSGRPQQAKEGRGDRPPRPQRGEGGPNEAGQSGRARDDRRPRNDERGAFTRSAVPPRRGPDPDSPFAALSALKLELERRLKDGKDTGSA